jgi:DNA-binding IclR family transcriptional regulator
MKQGRRATVARLAALLKLLEEQPKWIQEIPLKHLASYLGIAPETLSRIRRSIQSG